MRLFGIIVIIMNIAYYAYSVDYADDVETVQDSHIVHENEIRLGLNVSASLGLVYDQFNISFLQGSYGALEFSLYYNYSASGLKEFRYNIATHILNTDNFGITTGFAFLFLRNNPKESFLQAYGGIGANVGLWIPSDNFNSYGLLTFAQIPLGFLITSTSELFTLNIGVEPRIGVGIGFTPVQLLLFTEIIFRLGIQILI